jgi:hypothetical protein
MPFDKRQYAAWEEDVVALKAQVDAIDTLKVNQILENTRTGLDHGVKTHSLLDTASKQRAAMTDLIIECIKSTPSFRSSQRCARRSPLRASPTSPRAKQQLMFDVVDVTQRVSEIEMSQQ